jgi:hypothetical protein
MRWPVKILIPCLLLLGCGSGNGVVNNQPPSGTVIASGSLGGSTSSGAITGTVLVYDQCGGSYVVRFANLSAPGGIGLQVQADTTSGGGQRVNITTLGVTSGNVNYPVTAASGTGFSIVYLHSPGSNTDPAIATLTQTAAGC